MNEAIKQIQSYLVKNGIDAFIVFTADDHGSEYIDNHFKFREYLSGFDGSAGTLIVCRDSAYLWTDGRYFIQAERQLSNSGIILMKDGEKDVPSIVEFISNLASEPSVAFDFSTATVAFVNSLKSAIPSVKLTNETSLQDEVWANRPSLPLSKVYMIDDCNVGESVKSKLATLKADTKKQGCEHALISSLDDVAWLFNLRGSDVAYNPVNYAYAISSVDKTTLYINQNKLYDVTTHTLSAQNVQIKPYFAIYDDAKALVGKVLVDTAKTNYLLYCCLQDKKETCLFPTTIRKSIKNKVEIENIVKAHVEDGVALVKFERFLKENFGKIPMSEISLANALLGFRQESANFVAESFETICAFKDNGAIVHYSANDETNKQVMGSGLLLVDSGGQYFYGTTDVTRTYALGEISQKEKTHYTLVLKAHVALAMAVFEKNTYGNTLDLLAREQLSKHGLNYNHGTGHGVGYMLNCHEGPQVISPKAKNTSITTPFEEGMLTSNEPGVYVENEHGIRLENLMLCVKSSEEFFKFETITLAPFDLDAIDSSLLGKEEIDWLNAYHKQVCDTLSPLVDDDTKAYLANATRKI